MTTKKIKIKKTRKNDNKKIKNSLCSLKSPQEVQ